MSDPLDSLRRTLLSLALRLRPSLRQDAEDLVQETLIRGLPRILEGSERGLFAYLAKVMLNLVRDRWRQEAGRPAATNCDHMAAVLAEDPAPHHVLDDVRQALEQLSAFDRAVIDAIYFQGLNQAEAQVRLGRTRHEVRRSLVRAHQILATLLTR